MVGVVTRTQGWEVGGFERAVIYLLRLTVPSRVSFRQAQPERGDTVSPTGGVGDIPFPREWPF